MLVLLVVQSSNELRMMEQFAAPLLSIAKADDANAKLQGRFHHCCVHVCFHLTVWMMFGGFFLYTPELSKWLEPVEKLRFEIGSIPSLIDYIKQVLIPQSVYIYQCKVPDVGAEKMLQYITVDVS